MTETQKTLLALTRLGIGHQAEGPLGQGVDWDELNTIAMKQEVKALVCDGITRCFNEGIALDIERKVKLKIALWANRTENRYDEQLKVMRSLARFYQKHDIKMTVLKGIGLSMNYPNPKHRVSTDIDIYLNGEQKRADQLLAEKTGIKIDHSHHSHTVFMLDGWMVENHFDFLKIHAHRSNQRVEKKLKEVYKPKLIEEYGFYVPSPEFDAIFLLRHTISHFASVEMSIRQAVDWGFFVEKHRQEMDWEQYLAYLKEEGMYRFYNLLGLFCVRYLGFDNSVFPELEEDPLLDRFANEIISPEFKLEEKGNLWRAFIIKPWRWWHNRWKNELCYPDSMLSNFAYGLWAKILKPSHFRQ